ncbi:MAG: hypothetical protein HDR50_06860 [Desulfovibrio sp.]|uniref:hypothetical protein n=1 Tax=Desulfovibrio sp. TaxID=885 RepID=UPI001A75AB19|nr:hypothetical protein [Desulfovibrio sp.]MBD5417368.1 hypothetical protein [Desulfovibrio sp.]
MANISIKGGDKWRKALSKLAQDKVIKVRAGVLEDAKTTDGKLIAQYAAYNEFGAVVRVTPKMKAFFRHRFGINLKKQKLVIPGRPFMRRTLRNHRQEWVNKVAAALKAGRTPEDVLDLIGNVMAADIQAQIKSNMKPKNKPLTLMIKNAQESGRAGTLMNTGALIGAITSEVVK